MSGPPGLPKDIVERVNREVVTAFAKPEVQARLRTEQILTEPMTPAQFTKFVEDEYLRWKPVAQQIGLRVKPKWRSLRALSLPNAEHDQFGATAGLLDRVAGFANEIRNIEIRQRVGAFDAPADRRASGP